MQVNALILTLCMLCFKGTGNSSDKYMMTSPCEDKYKVIPNHTMCLQVRQNVIPVTDEDQKQLIDRHNKLRGSVRPEATDMLKMRWDTKLQEMAEKLAGSCSLTNDEAYQRYLPGMFTVGQNIAVRKTEIRWLDIVDIWYSEQTNFKYGQPMNRDLVGSYTQIVWAQTSRLGCGKSRCPGNHYFYVCNYGPSGNDVSLLSTPYNKGDEYCASCSKKGICQNNLCDCRNTTCFNGGILNVNTCSCDCKHAFTLGENCRINCTAAIDDARCNQTASCTQDPKMYLSCPNSCNICPYIDPSYKEGSITSTPRTNTKQGNVQAMYQQNTTIKPPRSTTIPGYSINRWTSGKAVLTTSGLHQFIRASTDTIGRGEATIEHRPSSPSQKRNGTATAIVKLWINVTAVAVFLFTSL